MKRKNWIRLGITLALVLLMATNALAAGGNCRGQDAGQGQGICGTEVGNCPNYGQCATGNNCPNYGQCTTGNVCPNYGQCSGSMDCPKNAQGFRRGSGRGRSISTVCRRI